MSFRNRKGLTLIEVLVAMAILTVIVAVTFNSLFTVLKARNISRERLQAMELSSSVMEEIKAYHSAWKNIAGLKTWLTGKGYTNAGNVYSRVETDSNSIDYRIKVSINANTGINGLFDISITAEAPNVSGINLVTRIRGE